MDYIGVPDVLGHFNRGSRELAKPFGIIWIVSGRTPVEIVAIEVRGIIDNEIAHAINHGSVSNGWEAETRSTHGNRNARQNHGMCFGSAISGENDRYFMTEADECLWQSLDYICETASLGKWQAFRRHKKDSQRCSQESFET
jgi:hypothetical protein